MLGERWWDTLDSSSVYRKQTEFITIPIITFNCMKSHVYWLSSSLASRTSSASLSSNFPNCFPSYFDTVHLTFCLSSGSISSASWCQASFCEELLHSGKQSCNPLLPAAPGCSQHTWEQTWTTYNCTWKQHIKSPHLIYDEKEFWYFICGDKMIFHLKGDPLNSLPALVHLINCTCRMLHFD